MENHPIPQDITGFQFKLIGSMTVRQFVYLAIGAVIAAFVFFILPIPFIIRLPVAIISISIGSAFAFIPIGGRPMDTMVGNFFKALFAPTQYVYQKTGGDLSKTPLDAAQDKQNEIVIPLPPPKESPASTGNIEGPTEVQKNLGASENLSDSETARLAKMLEDTVKQKEALEKELEALRTAPPPPQVFSQTPPLVQSQPPQPQPSPPQPPPGPEVLEGRQPLVQPQTPTVPAVQNTPVSQPEPPPPVVPNTAPPAPAAQPIKQAAGLPIPESPNLITGMVNDPRGNPLQGILVEVKDEGGSPVRAFKTNGLGQFAAATSLANGKYILVFEDPKEANKFDSLQIEADGNPIPPVQVTSVDPREELRRQLFN